MAAWYLSICFVISIAGALWFANLLGVVSFGGESADALAYKAAAKDAARKAAEQRYQARLSADEESRNIAADSTRLQRAAVGGPSVETAVATPTAATAPAAPTPPIASAPDAAQ